MLISAVIPVLDEADRIAASLAELSEQNGAWETIVVDGGSDDATFELAEGTGADRVLRAPRGRGPQMNAGARAARGELLLFLHADVSLPADAHRIIRDTLAPGRDGAEPIAGCFRTRTVAERPWPAPARALLRLADLRSRSTALPYGDQALFLRSRTFRSAGGFADLPLMEDLELARRLSRMGEIRCARASVRVSARRFQAAPVRAVLAMRTFPLAFRLGVSPWFLQRLYGQCR